MPSAAPLQAIDQTPPQVVAKPPAGGDRDFAEECLQRTAAALHESRAATDAEVRQGIDAVRESLAAGKPLDLLETMARIQGHDEEHLGPAILELGDKVALTLNPNAPLIPFAAKLIAPSAFYDSFEQIHKLARQLLSPVVYAEDTDAIGTASINPVAAAILADEIQSAVFKRFGIRPFVTIARMDYESWAFLTRKHFEL